MGKSIDLLFIFSPGLQTVQGSLPVETCVCNGPQTSIHWLVKILCIGWFDERYVRAPADKSPSLIILKKLLKSYFYICEDMHTLHSLFGS